MLVKQLINHFTAFTAELVGVIPDAISIAGFTAVSAYENIRGNRGDHTRELTANLSRDGMMSYDYHQPTT